jgi:hypothetical protein
MKLRDTVLAFICTLMFGFALLGCSENKPSKLDQDDIRFAGFYSDYLLRAGVTAGDDAIVSATFDSTELNDLLVRHALTRERLTIKVQSYKQNPELWQQVLVLVRENIHKKSSGAQ